MDLNKVNIEKLPADVRKTFKQMQLLLAEKKTYQSAYGDYSYTRTTITKLDNNYNP